MASFWNQTDLVRHIESHNKRVVSQFTVSIPMGTLAADFTIPLWVPPVSGYRFERAYLVCSAAHAPNGSAYWSLSLDQSIEGRNRALSALGTNSRTIAALGATPFGISDLGIALDAEEPIVCTGTKTGAPAALANCLIVMVLSVA
jgi:hypothetical protein